jgi:hypothetical protein
VQQPPTALKIPSLCTHALPSFSLKACSSECFVCPALFPASPLFSQSFFAASVLPLFPGCCLHPAFICQLTSPTVPAVETLPVAGASNVRVRLRYSFASLARSLRVEPSQLWSDGAWLVPFKRKLQFVIESSFPRRKVFPSFTSASKGENQGSGTSRAQLIPEGDLVVRRCSLTIMPCSLRWDPPSEGRDTRLGGSTTDCQRQI